MEEKPDGPQFSTTPNGQGYQEAYVFIHTAHLCRISGHPVISVRGNEILSLQGLKNLFIFPCEYNELSIKDAFLLRTKKLSGAFLVNCAFMILNLSGAWNL